MRLKPSDPDIRTLYSRIHSDELDLQPEFQRGEVWSDQKRQRLIDSILREWQVPPVHIILDNETGKQFVLDGQQRLASIRDFIEGRISINGMIEPIDQSITSLHGYKYLDLPLEVRRRFDTYSIRVFYVTDYSPEEPGELFFRLNQNSALSPAEQRNAFFGHARHQVKEIIQWMEESGIAGAYFGFSNARMAYDDIVARSLVVLEKQSLRHRVTAADLVGKYRSETGFSDSAVHALRGGLWMLSESVPSLTRRIKLNKATAFSWLVFAVRVKRMGLSPSDLGRFLSGFEDFRKDSVEALRRAVPPWSKGHIRVQALEVYGDRSTSRVSDVSSVVLRDLALWLHLVTELGAEKLLDGTGRLDGDVRRLCSHIASESSGSLSFEELAEELSWGAQL